MGLLLSDSLGIQIYSLIRVSPSSMYDFETLELSKV